MAMVVYKNKTALPIAIRSAISGMNSLAKIIRYVKTTAWYLSKANNARKSIIASLATGNGRSQIVNAPVARSTQIQMQQPRVRPGRSSGSITLSHREYLGEIAGSTTFSAVSFAVNPGLHSTFPWMAGIANSFECYKILSMSFEFVSIAATSERGRIALAFEYDALDANPTNKVDLFQIAGASEANVWSSTSLQVKPSSKLFTRVGTVASSDLKTYDHGKVIAGVSNTATAAVVGELFVTYVIELITPQPSKCAGAEVTAPVGAITAALPWTGATIQGALPITMTNGGPLFPLPGTYIVGYTFNASATDPGPVILTPTTGASIVFTDSSNSIPGLKTVGIFRVVITLPNAGVQVSATNNYMGLSTRMEIGYSNSF